MFGLQGDARRIIASMRKVSSRGNEKPPYLADGALGLALLALANIGSVCPARSLWVWRKWQKLASSCRISDRSPLTGIQA